MEISVRHAKPSDFEAIHETMSQPRAISGTMQLPYSSGERWRKRLTEPPPGYYLLVACIDNEVVGNVGLWTSPNSPRRKHVGDIGMAVHDDWQGKGVGTALMEAIIELADNWLNLIRLELEVFTDNKPAIGLYQKFGFEIEGTHRCFAFRDGQYVDAYFMARLRES